MHIEGGAVMNDVLPLVGEGDELDFLQEIERTFAIKLPQDLRHCYWWAISMEFSLPQSPMLRGQKRAV
jgi:hypothetical protein